MRIRIYILLFVLIYQSIVLGRGTFRDTCKITAIKIDKFGTLIWTTEQEILKRKFIIEDYRWNKWIKVGEVDGNGTLQPNVYSFKFPPHSGENKTRVSQENASYVSKEITWTSFLEKVTFKLDKKNKEIVFSSETMYEIIDMSGVLCKKGWGKSVSYDNLPKGNYTLNYDNSVAEFKK